MLKKIWQATGSPFAKLTYSCEAEAARLLGISLPSPFNCRSVEMATDPWSRPTLQDLHAVLESIEKVDPSIQRAAERLELSVPAEIVTTRGSVVPAMTREISRYGIGLLHRGSVSVGDATVKMASDTREYRYRVAIEWCRPADNGMFMSGGRFLSKVEDDE